MDIKIVTPTIGRYDNVLTKNVIDDLILICPESEKELYKKHNPDNEVIAHPENCKGISAVRQWIIQNFDNVFMLDDDIHQVHNIYRMEGEKYILSKQQAKEIIYQNFYLAKNMNVFYWGFSNKRRPVQYYPMNPFKLVGYVNGSNIGFLKDHKLSYDQRISDADDYYMACYNVYIHRKMLIDTRFVFETKDNFKAKGGASTYRNAMTMKDDTLLLRKLFGDCVQLKKASTFKKQVNEGERNLKFPI